MRAPGSLSPGLGRATILFLSIAAIGLPADLDAQIVTGEVVERGSARPLPGTWIALLDSLDAPASSTLTDPDGTFLLAAPGPGTYTLRTRLIGFEDTTSPAFLVGAGETMSRRVEIPVRALSLSGIEVGASKRCGPRIRGGDEIARLWEEARTALEILEWTEAEAALRYHVVRSRRVLDARTLRVQDLNEELARGIYAESPYISLPAARLAEEGYVQPAPDSTDAWDYWAPDATVLLSDSFLDAHCFEVAPNSDDDRVGLRFSPVEGREIPDIEGVLWLDRATGELRTLEFTYVGIPYGPGSWEGVGGRVDFERLATGVWIVRQWHIRMPRTADSMQDRSGRPEFSLRSINEEGATVLRVETLEGETLAQARGATLYGQVRVDETGATLADAVVDVVPTGFRAVTGEDGSYRLEGLPEGRFEIRITHPALERMGTGSRSGTIDLIDGRATRLPFDAEITRAAADFCRGSGIVAPTVHAVVGAARTPTDGGIPGLEVRIRAGDGARADVTTSADGGWAACLPGLDPGDSIEVAIALGPSRSAGVRQVAVSPGPFTAVDLEVDAEMLTAEAMTLPLYETEPGSDAVTTTVVDSAGGDIVVGAPGVTVPGTTAPQSLRVPVIGRVMDTSRGVPVPAARVTLLSTAGDTLHRAEAGADGRFLALAPDTDSVTVSVDALGYRGASTGVVPEQGAARLEIGIAPSPIALGGLSVTVEQRLRSLELGGFYRRRRGATGDFLDLTNMNLPSTVSAVEMVGRLGGVALGAGREPYFLRAQRPDLTGRGQSLCFPVIVVDGHPIRTSSGRRGRFVALRDMMPHADLIAAIEVFPTSATAPVQWRTLENECGVIAIWTRR